MSAPQARSRLVSIVLGVVMAVTSIVTGALTPTPRAPLPHEKFILDQMIPAHFGAWTLDPSVVPLQPDPEQQGVLKKIYDQTLSRTYVDAHGQRVMLSIAYGGDQSKALQLHLPEVCYIAQGFQLVSDSDDLLPTRYGQLPVKRLVARLHERNEPITYWITIGDKASKSGIEQKLRRLAYGLSGEIPDGMLVRVSTIEGNERNAYRTQDRFVAELLSALAPRDRAHLIGAGGAVATMASALAPGAVTAPATKAGAITAPAPATARRTSTAPATARRTSTVPSSATSSGSSTATGVSSEPAPVTRTSRSPASTTPAAPLAPTSVISVASATAD